MIDILLVGGYGRMGKAIQDVVYTHQYPVRIAGLIVEVRREDTDIPAYESLEEAIAQHGSTDCVIIDFSTPQQGMHVVSIAKKHAIPVVIGTTGFTKEESDMITACAQSIPILRSSNMSKGITALLRFLPSLVRYLGKEYDIELVELHHKHKKDAPSGTGLQLAQCLADAKLWELTDVARYHREGVIGERADKEIGIQTMRGGGAPGTHTIFMLGEDEHIEITHTAYSRTAFARGAVEAAMWIYGKPAGMYSMMDME